MNWAYELLGLAPGADAASVRRAYARLLRTMRPDEDPEGFQRLHNAYKTALAQANARPAPASHSSIVETETASSPDITPAPARPPSPRPTPVHPKAAVVPAVDLDALVSEVIRAAVQANDAAGLSNWLNARQELWSLQLKQQCGHAVLNRLFQLPQAISTECMDALLRFFDLDHVLSGVDPIALQALRTRQRARWEILPGNQRELARRMRLMWGSQPNLKALGKNIALLQEPRTWSRTVSVAFQFGRIKEISQLVQTLLGQGGIDELPPSIDQDHAVFWLRAAAPGLSMTRQRFIVGLLRATLAAWACALGLPGMLLMSSMGTPPTQAEWISAISTSIGTGAIVFALWLLFACMAWFDQWQGEPESSPSRWPWLRRLALPVACALGLASYEGGAVGFGGLLVGLSFIFAVRRFRRRAAKTNGTALRVGSMAPAFMFIGLAVARALSQMHAGDFPFVPAISIATAGVVIADLWRHRAHLNPKLARN